MITPYSNIISVTTLEGLLLDTYSGAAAAYSLRKLSSTYTGDAIRVRRASDNTEQDIGFVNNELDTSTLETFCSGTNGFVKTWYDQSGNANNATQTTAANQPQIVSSGSVILENGKSAIEFDESNNTLLNMAGLDGQSLIDSYFVTSTSDTAYLYPNVGSSSPYGFVAQLNQNSISGPDNYGSPSLYVNNTLITNVTWANVYTVQNGYKVVVHQGADTSAWSIYSFGNYAGMYGYTGYLQELIAYTSSQASNRTGIQDNINDFYSIYP